MNNGRYLSIMDLGRLDLLMRTDLMGALLKHRWQPLVGGVSMRYRQSLLPLARYKLHTKVIGWDDKWFYMEQKFTKKNRLIAVGLVKALFRGKGRNLSPDEVLRLIKVNIEAPQIPERVLTWLSMDPK
jgi:acyl-CoA thioesterase FadM